MSKHFIVLAALTAATFLPSRAFAYRPFEETNAEVAETGELELEMGALGITHVGEHNFYSPGLIVNWGFYERFELVLENSSAFLLGGGDGASASFVQTNVLVKYILREGVLQEKEGISIALEGGVLVPTFPHMEDHVGASIAGIASYRWPFLTVHVNARMALNRESLAEFLGGVIVEGPYEWTVRPVAELFIGDVFKTGTSARAALLGGIWRITEKFSADAAFRLIHEGAEDGYEVRAGITYGLAI